MIYITISLILTLTPDALKLLKANSGVVAQFCSWHHTVFHRTVYFHLFQITFYKLIHNASQVQFWNELFGCFTLNLSQVCVPSLLVVLQHCYLQHESPHLDGCQKVDNVFHIDSFTALFSPISHWYPLGGSQSSRLVRLDQPPEIIKDKVLQFA